MKNVANNDYAKFLQVVEKSKIKNEQPRLYQVILFNDDFTPMEFVVDILGSVFFMDRIRATETMFEAHTQGKAVCGVYTKDVAATKISEVAEYAQINQHPLFCTLEAAR